ncbi:MAG: hypothetical protein IT427_14545 [Pirellulales bacterium]|nr:hypothetical protein [Pirellulales bacterium]
MSQFAQGLSLDKFPMPAPRFCMMLPIDARTIQKTSSIRQPPSLFSIDPRHASNLENTRKFPIHFASAFHFFAHPPGNEPEMNAAIIFAALEKNALFQFLHFHHKNIFRNRTMTPNANSPEINP